MLIYTLCLPKDNSRQVRGLQSTYLYIFTELITLINNTFLIGANQLADEPVRLIRSPIYLVEDTTRHAK